jgi:hypothetical protein
VGPVLSPVSIPRHCSLSPTGVHCWLQVVCADHCSNTREDSFSALQHPSLQILAAWASLDSWLHHNSRQPLGSALVPCPLNCGLEMLSKQQVGAVLAHLTSFLSLRGWCPSLSAIPCLRLWFLRFALAFLGGSVNLVPVTRKC